MALLVQKYGGTSVGSVERLQAVAKRVAASKAEGHDLVVVVSAMGRTTDELTSLAKARKPARATVPSRAPKPTKAPKGCPGKLVSSAYCSHV
ncbi:MAG: hypothetical protein EB119_07005, partial [Synechococcaceae bacterium WBB_34_004]|nr:hypothetical protein [Synechococcaceae bacterium WBB_34_004]